MVKNGPDEQRFTENLEAAAPKLRATVRRLVGHPDETDDLVQQATLQAWERRTGNGNRPGLFAAGVCSLVNKQGVCYQCKGLRDIAPADRQGPALPRDLDLDERLRLVAGANDDGTTAVLHAVFWRRTREIEQAGLAINTAMIAFTEVGLVWFLVLPGYVPWAQASVGLVPFALAAMSSGVACQATHGGRPAQER